MKNLFPCLAAICLPALLVILTPSPASARPQYSSAFLKTYDKIEKAKELKCGICHGEGGKNKKVLSDYATALKESLELKKDGEKVVPETNADKIKAALEKTEGMEDPTNKEKKFGDYLKAGELPPPAK